MVLSLRARDHGVRVQQRAVLRDLQGVAESPDSLANRGRGVGVLRPRLRSRQAAVRAVSGPLRHLRPRGLERQPLRPRAVPAVGLLHGLCVLARRRGRRDVRSGADAAGAGSHAGMTPIDLRSDTVTRPSAAMRRAIAEAEVGDDVLDGDPTTRRLEERVADLLGMEDALFFPSGTQANETGIALCTQPGTELLVEANAHLVHYELAGVAMLSGVQIRPISTPGGVLTADLVRGAIRIPSPHLPRASALAIENTHNAAGGTVMSAEQMTGVVAVARDAGLAVHLDGARLWNAAAALQVTPRTLSLGATTAMVSLSKGLGCPVGSCLAFRKSLRPLAWETRKRLGGGMRQSGILAAAALYSLEHNLERIGEDHEHAQRFASCLADCTAIRVSRPETNIVMLDLTREQDTAATVAPRLARAGVLLAQWGVRRLRGVTHLDVDRRRAGTRRRPDPRAVFPPAVADRSRPRRRPRRQSTCGRFPSRPAADLAHGIAAVL